MLKQSAIIYWPFWPKIDLRHLLHAIATAFSALDCSFSQHTAKNDMQKTSKQTNHNNHAVREFCWFQFQDTWLQGFYTSGSTGTPKSVTHTHKSLGQLLMHIFIWMVGLLECCDEKSKERVLPHSQHLGIGTEDSVLIYPQALQTRGFAYFLLHILVFWGTIQALKINEDEGDCWGHFGPLFHCGTPAFVWISVAWWSDSYCLIADGQRKSTRSQDRSRHRLNTFKLSQGYGRCSTSVSWVSCRFR